MDRPDPAEYQPSLTRWGHVWRVGLTLIVSAVAWVPLLEKQTRAEFLLDIVLGLVAFVLVIGFRRRWPVPIALLANVLAAFSAIASGPAVLAVVSVATRRRWREISLVTSVGFAGALFFGVWQPTGDDSIWLLLTINAIVAAAMIAWGLYIGSRRELIWTLRHRAERAESEQELRVAQARANERARIAREMHDVLAHRISQVSMHAGALAFREDLTPDEVRSSATVIREKAHEALTDLRGVLGVLRGTDGEPALAPQPTYADLDELVGEARTSGLNIELVDRVVAPEDVPEAAGRTLYRIVQEGITNARKHAPRTLLTIEVSGSPQDGLDVVLRNPLGFGSETPGAGLGLVGLSERAELRGGRLEAHREGTTFVLRGWIPWAA